MSNANVPYVLDNMNFMTNVHNRKCIEQLRRKIQRDDDKILEFVQRIEELAEMAGEREEGGNSYRGDCQEDGHRNQYILQIDIL